MKANLKVKNPAALAKLIAKYKVKFDAKPGYIDMRTMSKNYSTGVIPWQDIEDINTAIIGTAPAKPNSVNPREQKGYTLELGWELMSSFGILTEIQRDLIPSHIYEIELDFDGKKISVILAMEDPVTGLICPFDGHHTARAISRQGWTHAPCFVLRAPKEMIDKDPMEARKYLMRIAGEAFLSINLTHKKGVGGYDQFIIKRDYGDPDAVAISNILIANNAKAVRIAKDPGNISHYPYMWASYDIRDKHLNKGTYLDLALLFHRATWPAEQIYGATLVGLAHFFHKCDKHKVTLDKTFMDDLAQALKDSYKLSKFTHEGYKAAYIKDNEYGSSSDELIVTCGLVHTYNKRVGKVNLYTPELQFRVK
jgi:hypothetical protein